MRAGGLLSGTGHHSVQVPAGCVRTASILGGADDRVSLAATVAGPAPVGVMAMSSLMAVAMAAYLGDMMTTPTAALPEAVQAYRVEGPLLV